MTAASSSSDIKATVLVPTIAGRGALLPLTVGSVLGQTVREIEVFIIGDGVDDDSRRIIQKIQANDGRVRFFDFPKHPRRGEPNRHAALQEAQGEIVCYLTDRDLMLPNHVETMLGLLEDTDFVHSLILSIKPDGTFLFEKSIDLSQPADRAWCRWSWCDENGIPLSFAAHTLAMYRQLPHGWRTTPRRHFTDIYMWQQFLREPNCRAASGTTPTILYFPKYLRPCWPVDRKLKELRRWSDLAQRPDGECVILQAILDCLAGEARARSKRYRWFVYARQALWEPASGTAMWIARLPGRIAARIGRELS